MDTMNEITQVNRQLPTNIEDLSRFVLIGREQLVAVRAAIRAIDKVGVAQEVREQKLREAQEISEAVLDAEVRIGELMAKVPKGSGGDRRSEVFKTDTGVHFETKAEVIERAGFTPKQVQRFETLAAHPEIVAQAKAEARENDDIVSRSLVLNMVRQKKKEEEQERAREAIEEEQRGRTGAVLFVGNSIGRRFKQQVDLLLTDPPYATDVPDIDAFAQSWLPAALGAVKDTGFAYVFIGAYPEELRAYLNIVPPEHMKLAQVLIWTYKNTLGQNPKDRYKQNYQACLFYRGIHAPDLDCPLTAEQWAVQEINAPDGRQGDRYHSWQKPMEIAERFIRHSTEPGALVYDPFACTGTFLIAASKLGRRCIGFEIDEENAKIAEQRGVRVCREETT